VPLEFDYSETPLEEKVAELVVAGKAPIYLVHFTQLACAHTAQNLLSSNFCTKEEKQTIAGILRDANFRSPYGKEISKLLRHGIGIHHAGLLPKYRVLVEKLTQRGLLKVICGTDTLGVGVNVPIRTVLFTQLFKYDGNSTRTLAVRDFQQIAGRAGRRGFDTSGTVVAQAPEHMIANIQLEKKAAASGKKSFVKRKPPDKGFVGWDEKSFRRLIESPPEKLVSSFQIQHSLLLHMLGRRHEDGCAALRKLIRECHEPPAKKKALRRRAFQLFRGLVQGDILRIIPRVQRRGPAKVMLNIDLEEDFSMNQALGLYLLDTIPRLDRESPDYALNVISLIEAILENPDVILRKQVDLLKGELIAQLKNEGIEFDERMALLDEVEWPKPGKEFIYATYNAFVARRPWMKDAAVHPKAIAREMFEHWQSFEDYVKTYGLERSEAVLLRILSEVYKVLSQTVQPAAKTPDLIEAEAFFEDILRGVDSSLLDEWEKLRHPDYVPEPESPAAVRRALPLTRDRPVFTRTLRHAIFTLVKACAQNNPAAILSQIEAADPDGHPWTLERLEYLLENYFAHHPRIRLDPEARATKHTRLSETGPRRWTCEQTLVDPEDWNDWSLKLVIDLDRSDAEGRPVLVLEGLAAIE
jgi:superfamily II RNA helicase